MINDLNRWTTRPWSHTDHSILGYSIRIPEYMADLITRVHAAADIVWCTTWEDRANEHISPLLGLPQDLPFVTLSFNLSYTAMAKYPGAMEFAAPYLDADAPVLWVEDFDWLGFRRSIVAVDTSHDLVLTPDQAESRIFPVLA